MSVVDDGELTEADAVPIEPAPDELWDEPVDEPLLDDGPIRRVIDAVVVAGCVLFVFWQLHPGLILADNTPTGGDMGAHVWAFGYLRDTLLPSGQLVGWTGDWYAGFPAFQFYMVVPFLAMVVLNAGGSGMVTVLVTAASAAVIGRVAGVPRAMLWLPPAAAAAAVGAIGVLAGFGPGFQFLAMATLVGTALVAFWSGSYGWGLTPTVTADPRLVRAGLTTAAVAIALGGISLPYGVAFKVVAVSGVCAMPACAYLFGRLANLAYPIPALLAVCILAFEFDTNFTIYGGNIPSTMAGEFAFSIALALAIAYLGLLIRGLRTGRGRATAAGVLALVGLCHLLPAFFALLATAVLLLVHVVDERRPGRERPALLAAGTAMCALLVAAAVAGVLDLATSGPIIAVTVAGLVIVALVWNLARAENTVAEIRAKRWEDGAGSEADDGLEAETLDVDDGVDDPDLATVAPGYVGVARTWWLVSMGIGAGLLSAFWVLPFYWKQTYLNDMGWEKISVHREGTKIWTWFSEEVAARLVPTSASDFVDHAPTDLRVWAVLAIVGGLLSIAFRNRVGTALLITAIVLAFAFVYVPQGRLWNARILPFWYLVIYLLAAIGIGEIVRSIAAVATDRPDRPARPLLWAAGPLVFLAVGLFLAAQLQNLPVLGSRSAAGTYQVGVGPATVDVGVKGGNIARGWSEWNFRGYEGKDRYAEYRAIVDTMATIGQTRGCGRAMWEYSSELNSYGTPMALMLLPHWTEGCIGSMEGLYFEASSTTPFHFLMQSELSTSPSRAQRDMPYRDFDVDAGVGHMQLLGVRYYMTYTPEATEAARGHAALAEVISSEHWTVFEVSDAPLVEGLAFEPAVTTASEKQKEGWLCASEHEVPCSGVALDWFQDPGAWDVALAASGPAEWQRVDPDVQPQRRPVTPAVVSDIDAADDRISFTVDRVGSPVLVKASYFPNWSVSGADGPYRVAPNLMVVVPTDTEVTLTYGRTSVDWLSILLSVAGLALLVVYWRRGAVAVPELRDDTVA